MPLYGDYTEGICKEYPGYCGEDLPMFLSETFFQVEAGEEKTITITGKGIKEKDITVTDFAKVSMKK